MMANDKNTPASNRWVGEVTGTGIVIGDNSSASVVMGQMQSSTQIELSQKLGDFIDLLARHEGSVEDATDVRKALLEAQREVAESAPRWPILRTLLRGIAVSVSGVTALTEAMNNILALLGRMPR